ncbi:N-acetylglucosamine-6-phosphate deacetylase [Mycetocola tolaasinivorans]|uniref:N-acetylglucosamine-6-phosphate deacetylase n=1 Tax=Mycetocola tolaasinivorans TaxID=76635 RepID=A0A3L7ABG3_9MICO|nr:N-acetylglucosamine-6-phosphate deacetylase [Mycetocola tolaasinivorans]RLP77567.1 N-acetylglucosamine-6-phosphate deacetylase [Mycetocola tolaasinivorans]
MRNLIHSATVVSGGQSIKHAWIEFDADGIIARGTDDTWRARAAEHPEATVIDGTGRVITPGLIDLHCHGGAAVAFEQGPEAIRTALALHRSHGTTRAVVSFVSGGIDDLVERLGGVADLVETDPGVLGSHLEGPFLDPGHRGAHDPEALRTPDMRTVDRLIEAGQGTLRQITIAPELDGAAEAIRELTAAGVIVAVGHTDADYAAARAAFDAGATLLTHAFNAMHPIHHRAPGPVLAAVDSPGVTLEVINDGVHVHESVVRLAFTEAPGRIALVTDAMAATGAADGLYSLGSLEVMVTDGTARLVEGGAIAGSTLTLDAALHRAVHVVGIALPEAVRALTETPARVLGRERDLGSLEPGYPADVLLWSDDLTLQRVWAGGTEYPAAGA